MAALPACIQPRLGLEVFGFVPPGCFGYLVDDTSSEPILRPGDFAIIDVNDREPGAGSLFLIEYMHGDRHIVEAYTHLTQSGGRERVSWWVADYNRPRSREDLEEALAARRELSTSDGPYEPDHLASKLIGRVVGVLAPDRHSRAELARQRDVANCPPHILADGYGKRPRGYKPPAGSAEWRAKR